MGGFPLQAHVFQTQHLWFSYGSLCRPYLQLSFSVSASVGPSVKHNASAAPWHGGKKRISFDTLCILHAYFSHFALSYVVLLHFYLHRLSNTTLPASPCSSLKAVVGFSHAHWVSKVIKRFRTVKLNLWHGHCFAENEEKNMCHAAARCVTSTSKNATKGYFRLAARSYICFGAVSGKAWACAAIFFCQVSSCALRRRFRERKGDFSCVYISVRLPHLVVFILCSLSFWRRPHFHHCWTHWLVYKEGLS